MAHINTTLGEGVQTRSTEEQLATEEACFSEFAQFLDEDDELQRES